MSFHSFRDEDGNEYGSFEVFHMDENDLVDVNHAIYEEVAMSLNGFNGVNYTDEEVEEIASEDYLPPGWYWWACFPGCLPDGDYMGPFASYEEALEDARWK